MDPFDVRLEDTELLDEVELTANLIVAANQSVEHMSAAEIDQILGIVLPLPATASEPIRRVSSRDARPRRAEHANVTGVVRGALSRLSRDIRMSVCPPHPRLRLAA